MKKMIKVLMVTALLFGGYVFVGHANSSVSAAGDIQYGEDHPEYGEDHPEYGEDHPEW